MLKQVRSYETGDGKLFTDRPSALTHQLSVDMRGLMQSNGIDKLVNITVTDISTFMATHATEVQGLLGKYRDAMRRAQKAS